MKRTFSACVVYGALVAVAIGQTKGAYSEIFGEPESLVDAATAASELDPGYGFIFGALRISPVLTVGYNHDSNPTYARHGAKAINTIQARPQVDFLLNGNGWDSFGSVWLTHDWLLGSVDPLYRDAVTQSHYGESLGVRWLSPRGSSFSLTESYEYQNRNDFVGSVATNTSWQDRYSLNLGAQFTTPLGEHTGMNVGASYSELWYDNPLLYGWQDAGVTLGFTRKLTEKSDVLLSLGGDNQWSDGSDGESRSYRVLAGFGTRPSAKTACRAEVGVMGYSYNDGENTAASWTYSLSGNWRVSQRLSANVSGTANFQPSETDNDNYTLVQLLSAGLTFEATCRLTTSLNAVARREAYGKAVSGEKRTDDQVGLVGRASYQLQRNTSVYVGADYSKNISTLEESSFNRMVLSSGVNIRF